MLSLFRKWMISIATGAFLLTFLLSYFLLDIQAKDNAQKEMIVTLNYLKQKIARREFNTQNLQAYFKKNLQEKADVFAMFRAAHPEWMTKKLLENYIARSGVDQISILDESGNYISSYPDKLTGNKQDNTTVERIADLDDLGLAVQYLPASELILERFQTPARQLVGVSVKDEILGTIQLGQDIDKYNRMLSSEGITTIAEFLKVGYMGSILIIRNGRVSSSNIEDIIGKTLREIDFHIPSLKDDFIQFNAFFRGEAYFCMAVRYQQYELVAIYPETELYLRRKNILKWGIPLYLLLFLLIYLAVVTLLKLLVLKSIIKINKSLKKITSGDLDEHASVTTTPEFKELSTMINKTVDSLKTEINKTAQSMKQELFLAQEVQFSALPKTFPPFPFRTEFDLFASLHAAKEVSGDFFDFFTLESDSSKLVFLIADVAGKGIPASLFMMSARALIKRYAREGYSIDDLLKKVNNALCEDNETAMFLTMLIGVLDIETGFLKYANAGHDWPYIQSGDGDFREIALDSGYPLGIKQNAVFDVHEVWLKYGDTFFAYTDGVTEAERIDDELYGNDRLLAALNKNKNETLQNLVYGVNADIIDFTKGAQQSDDITMLCLRYQGEQKTVSADIENEEEILEFFFDIFTKNDCPEEIQNELAVILDEVFTNIVHYAYPEQKGDITVFCSVGGYPKRIKMQFIDSGIPFNPLNNVEGNLEAPAHQRQVGHLGIFLVKQLADETAYEYRDGKNILTLFKNL